MVSNSSEQPSPGVDEEMEDDGDDWDSSTSSPGVTITTERSTTTPSGSNCLADRPPTPVPATSRSPTVEEINQTGIDGLGCEATDLNLLIPLIDPNDKGAYQVSATQSHKSPTPVDHTI